MPTPKKPAASKASDGPGAGDALDPFAITKFEYMTRHLTNQAVKLYVTDPRTSKRISAILGAAANRLNAIVPNLTAQPSRPRKGEVFEDLACHPGWCYDGRYCVPCELEPPGKHGRLPKPGASPRTRGRK